MITLEQLAKDVGGTLSASAKPAAKVVNFHIRPWSCGKGSVFLPIFTATASMAPRAIKRGAVAVMTDEDIDASIPHIRVKDLQKTAVKMATKKRKAFSGKLIGITGSAGKSTTKTMLQHVLEQDCKVFSTTNNQNLTPYLTAAMSGMETDLDYAVLEMAMYTVDMVKDSAALARPHAGIVTSIGMNHAEVHEDPYEGILNSKTEMFWGMEPDSTAILPSLEDRYDDLCRRAKESKRIDRIISCGYKDDDDVQLIKLDEHPTHTKVKIRVEGKNYSYIIPLPGTHVAHNSLLAAGTLLNFGEPIEMMETMHDYVPPRSSIRRFEMHFPDRRFELIDDAIISSPHQVQALLQIVAMRPKAKRRLFIFGDMSALGEDAEKLHRDLAPEIEAAGIDKLIAVGPLSAQLAEELSIPTKTYKNSHEAAKFIDQDIDDDDLVIMKASGPTNFKIILKALYAKTKRKLAPPTWTIEGVV